jgi:hypothetical protein
MAAFTVFHPLEVRMFHKAVKLYKTSILSWALIPLGYVTPDNENDFTLSPLMRLDAEAAASRNLPGAGAVLSPEYQLIRS